MKKLSTLFALAALLLLPVRTFAQVDLTVADGGSNNQYVPVYGYWADAAQHNQVLYPADSLDEMVGGVINSLTFYLQSQATGEWNITVTLSLGTTDATSLSGLDNTTALTQVWQGTMNANMPEISIALDNPYDYSGGNLLLDIVTTAGTYKGANFYGMSLDGASYYSYTSSSGSTSSGVQNFLPKTTFNYIPGSSDYCYKPKNIAFSEISNQGATVSWGQPYGGGSEYAVFVDGVEVGSTFDTFYTVSGVSANEDHTVQVKHVCNPGDSSAALVGTFHTLCQEGNCQVQVIPGAQYTSSTYMPHARFYQNGSLLADVSSTTSVDICNGDSLIIIYQAPNYSYSPTLQIIDAGGTDLFNGSTNSYSTGDTLLAVANGCPSCIPPVSVHQTPEDAFSTTIHWTDNNVDGLGEYVVIVNDVEYPVSGDSNYVLATWPLSHYDVSVARICDGNDTSAFRNISFNAPCDESVYAEVPFFSGFEELNNNESPDCWVQVQTGGNAGLGSVFPSAYRWAPNAHTGSVYFEFESASGNETEVLALPRMEDVSTLQLSFYASTTTSTYKFTLEAGVIEIDEGGEYVFVPVDTIQLQAGSGFSESYHVYNVLFDTYEGNGERLALRTTPNPPTNTSIYTLMLDDFNVIRVGVPVLGPFEHSVYSINMGDTLHLSANLMTGEVESWTWTSAMIESGEAVIVSQDSNDVTIVYLAAGTDILTVTASNSNGEASKSVTVNIIDNSLINVYPYSTGFEPGEDRSWYTDGDLNGWYIGNATSYDESGTSLYISRDNGVSNMMADGLTCRSYAYRHFDMLNGGEFSVNFWWKGNGDASSRYMRVYLASGEVNPTHGSSPQSSWTLVATCTAANDWTEFSNVVEADTGVHTLIFYWYGTGNVNPPHAVDNITIDKLNCSRVGHLTASNVFAHSADISWTPRNGESNWYIQVDSTEGYSVSDTVVSLTGFAGESHHTVVVRALCDAGDTSYASTVEFTTTISCPAVTNIHTADATSTSATIEWTAGGEETAWKVCVDGGDTVDVFDNPSYTISGLLPVTGHTIMVMADCGDEDGQSVASNYNFHTLCDDGSCDIVFNLTDSYSGMDGWNGGAIRVVQNGVEVGSATIANGSNQATVNVPVCSSMPASLVFTAGSYPSEMGGTVETLDGTVVYTISGMTSSMNNDTLATVESPCPTCMPATNIVVDAISATECTIKWSPMGSNTNWAVYLDGEQVGGVVTDTVYTFTALEANTNYTFGVRALCEDNDSSALRTVSARTDCANGNCTFTVEMADSYGDGWSGNSIEVYQNGALFQTLTITSGNNNIETVSTCLGDSVMLFWHTGSYSSEASFTVKDAADSVLLTSGTMGSHVTGDTIMYFDGLCNATVVMSQGSTPGPGPQPGTCGTPTNLSATATETTATVTFSGYADSYEVEIVAGSWQGSMGNAEPISTTSHTFTDLQPGTAYSIAVRSVCVDDYDGDTTYSDWATTAVTTQTVVVEGCDVPTDLEVVDGTVDTTSVVLHWTDHSSANRWQIKLTSSAGTDTLTVTGTTYSLNGLTPATSYYAQVRALCSDTLFSGWSETIIFQTASHGTGIDGIEGGNVSLYPNPADRMVTITATEPAMVTIVDISGREVYRSADAATTHRVELTDFARGAYFVRISGQDIQSIRKLVVK